MKTYVYIIREGIHIETKSYSNVYTCTYMCIRIRWNYDIPMFDPQVWCVCVCVCVSVCTKLGKFRFLRASFLILQKYYAFCSTFDEVTVTEQSHTYLFTLFEL